MRSDSEMVNLRSVIETLCYMVDEDSDGVEEVMQLPTIELVTCAECKYWQDNNGGYPTTECRWGHDETPNADDFCSYGEREGE